MGRTQARTVGLLPRAPATEEKPKCTKIAQKQQEHNRAKWYKLNQPKEQSLTTPNIHKYIEKSLFIGNPKAAPENTHIKKKGRRKPGFFFFPSERAHPAKGAIFIKFSTTKAEGSMSISLYAKEAGEHGLLQCTVENIVTLDTDCKDTRLWLAVRCLRRC